MQARDDILRGLTEIAALHAAASAVARHIYSAITDGERAAPYSDCTDPAYEGCGSHIRVDAFMHSVEWAGHRCVLGPSLLFRMIQRLARQPNRYFGYDVLMQEIWKRRCSDEAIRALVKRLRRALIDAGMAALASSIQVRHRSLGLFLDGRAV